MEKTTEQELIARQCAQIVEYYGPFYVVDYSGDQIIDTASGLTLTSDEILGLLAGIKKKVDPSAGSGFVVKASDETQTGELPEFTELGAEPTVPEKLKTFKSVSNGDIRVGHYLQNSTYYVVVDALSGQTFAFTQPKDIAFNYRLNIGLPNAGIELCSVPIPLAEDVRPYSLFGKRKHTTTTRAVFRLVQRN